MALPGVKGLTGIGHKACICVSQKEMEKLRNFWHDYGFETIANWLIQISKYKSCVNKRSGFWEYYRIERRIQDKVITQAQTMMRTNKQKKSKTIKFFLPHVPFRSLYLSSGQIYFSPRSRHLFHMLPSAKV